MHNIYASRVVDFVLKPIFFFISSFDWFYLMSVMRHKQLFSFASHSNICNKHVNISKETTNLHVIGKIRRNKLWNFLCLILYLFNICTNVSKMFESLLFWHRLQTRVQIGCGYCNYVYMLSTRSQAMHNLLINSTQTLCSFYVKSVFGVRNFH